MKKIFKILICALWLNIIAGVADGASLPSTAAKLAVFTDYEADDAVAIGLLMKFLKEHHIEKEQFLIGALLSNQYRKKALVQEMVKLFGYDAQNIYAGTGGIKEPFEEEGRNILSADSLQRFVTLDKEYLASNDPAAHQDAELHSHFTNMLQQAAANSVDVLLLTNPIDFVKALAQNKDNLCKINKIYMMGGWFGNKPTFNWNLHIESVNQLLELMKKESTSAHSPQLIIFSSHFFAREFNGYVNQNKFPEVIKAFDQSKNSVANHLRNMVKNWDDSMTVIKDSHTESDKEWRREMVERIGKENIGRQFTPADPATVLGYLYPEQFIVEKTPIHITLTTVTGSNGKKSSTVDIQHALASNVFVVEKVNLKFFNDKLVELMSMAPPR